MLVDDGRSRSRLPGCQSLHAGVLQGRALGRHGRGLGRMGSSFRRPGALGTVDVGPRPRGIPCLGSLALRPRSLRPLALRSRALRTVAGRTVAGRTVTARAIARRTVSARAIAAWAITSGPITAGSLARRAVSLGPGAWRASPFWPRAGRSSTLGAWPAPCSARTLIPACLGAARRVSGTVSRESGTLCASTWMNAAVRGRRRLALGPLGRFLASLGQQAIEIGRRDAFQDTEVGLRQLGRLEVPKQHHSLAIGVVFLGSLGRQFLRPFLRLLWRPIAWPIVRPIVPRFRRAGGPGFAPPSTAITRARGCAALSWSLSFGPARRVARARALLPSRLRRLPGAMGRVASAMGRVPTPLRLLLDAPGLLAGPPTRQFRCCRHPVLFGQLAAGGAVEIEALGATGQRGQVGIAAGVSAQECRQRLPGEHPGGALLDVGLDPQFQRLGGAREQAGKQFGQAIGASLGGQLGWPRSAIGRRGIFCACLAAATSPAAPAIAARARGTRLREPFGWRRPFG